MSEKTEPEPSGKSTNEDYNEIKNLLGEERINNMRYYKILNVKTGLFSTGGLVPKWNKDGKTWTSKKNLNLHLNMLKSNKLMYLYKDCKVLSFIVVNGKSQSIKNFLDS